MKKICNCNNSSYSEQLLNRLDEIEVIEVDKRNQKINVVRDVVTSLAQVIPVINGVKVEQVKQNEKKYVVVCLY